MDEYMFDMFVQDSIEVDERTSYLEMFNYSDPTYNTCEQHPLTLDEFHNFLHRRGAFEPPELPQGVKLISALRLVIQSDVQHPDTFQAKTISLPRDVYADMVRVLRLPYKGIETSAVVGPFFWSTLDEDEEGDPILQIVNRKSDVRKKGKTRGWELMLSHSLATATTTGYIKGTPSSNVVRVLEHTRSSRPREWSHPMLLPVLLLAHDLSPANDQKQRDARDWVRRLENAVSMRDEVHESEAHMQPDGLLEIDGLSRDLVECQGQVMWRRPQAYTAVCDDMEAAMDAFAARLRRMIPTSADLSISRSGELSPLQAGQKAVLNQAHRGLASRIAFYQAKLKGLENYIHTTLKRLKIQREALYNIMSQREARLNLEIAREQRRIAHSSKRDSTAMKTLSLLGAVFLPGTYLASFFDMSFFSFAGANQQVSPKLWVYFAVTLPITAAIIVAWLVYDRRRQAQHRRDDEDLEKSIEMLEKEIMRHMRKRTMSKAQTWTQPPPPP